VRSQLAEDLSDVIVVEFLPVYQLDIDSCEHAEHHCGAEQAGSAQIVRADLAVDQSIQWREGCDECIEELVGLLD